MYETPAFRCSFSLHAGLGYLDESRLRLLQEIRASGTLTAAAEAMGISYKTAWSWLDAMGNAASGPLVESVQGGSHGGQSRLTPLGISLIDQFEELRERHGRFLSSLEASPPLDDVRHFLRRLSLHTSARNQLHGKVERIWGDKTQAWVDVRIDGLAVVTARVSHESASELGLSQGEEIMTHTKATCLSLSRPEDSRPLSRKGPVNHIAGRLARAIVDEGHTQASLEIAAGRTLTALVNPEAWEKLDARIGSSLIASFDPDHVTLAKWN